MPAQSKVRREIFSSAQTPSTAHTPYPAGSGDAQWFLQAGAVPRDGTLDGFGQVVPQMPPARDLDGQRRSLAGAL